MRILSVKMEDMENSSDENSAYMDYYYTGTEDYQLTVDEKIWLSYVIPMLIALVGNPLTAIVMHRLSRSVCSTCIYVATSAMLDLFLILILCGNFWLGAAVGIDLTDEILKYSDVTCRIYTLIAMLITHLSHYMNIAIMAECAIAVLLPTRARKMCTYERGQAVILVMTAILIGFNFHWFWSYKLYTVENRETGEVQETCNYLEKYMDFGDFFNMAEFIVKKVITTITALLLTIAIIVKYIRQKQLVNLDDSHKKYLIYPDDYKKLQNTFFTITLVYLAFSLPALCLDAAQNLFFRIHGMKDEFLIIEFYTNFSSAKNVIDYVFYLFLACKLPISMLTSPRFRKELKKLLLSWCCCCTKFRSRMKKQGYMTTNSILLHDNTDLTVLSCEEA